MVWIIVSAINHPTQAKYLITQTQPHPPGEVAPSQLPNNTLTTMVYAQAFLWHFGSILSVGLDMCPIQKEVVAVRYHHTKDLEKRSGRT